jgi:hypothetical protein
MDCHDALSSVADAGGAGVQEESRMEEAIPVNIHRTMGSIKPDLFIVQVFLEYFKDT